MISKISEYINEEFQNIKKASEGLSTNMGLIRKFWRNEAGISNGMVENLKKKIKKYISENDDATGFPEIMRSAKARAFDLKREAILKEKSDRGYQPAPWIGGPNENVEDEGESPQSLEKGYEISINGKNVEKGPENGF